MATKKVLNFCVLLPICNKLVYNVEEQETFFKQCCGTINWDLYNFVILSERKRVEGSSHPVCAMQ